MMGSGLLLLAIVAGYWLLERASKNTGGLKLVGRILGIVVIVVGLFGTVCRVWCASTGKPACYKSSGIFCPYSGGSGKAPQTP